MIDRQIQLVREEHPRVCGENSLILTSPVRLSGTSPRMRENEYLRGSIADVRGTSPRMRGK